MTPVLGILIAIASGIGLVAICIIVVMRLKYTHGYQNASHPGYPETHIQLNKPVLNNPDVIPADKGKYNLGICNKVRNYVNWSNIPTEKSNASFQADKRDI